MPEKIVFPDRKPHWEFDRDCLSFPAFVEGRLVKCLVTAELLMSQFGARDFTQKELERAYTEHKAAIQGVARSLIEAGQVMQNNEVLVTTRVFRLKIVSFTEKLQRNRELFHLAQKTTEWLEEIVGSSAGLTEAEWDVGEDARGRAVVTLRLSDWTGSVTGVFDPRELESAKETRFRLHRIWGDLLQIRSHRQLEEIQIGDGSLGA